MGCYLTYHTMTSVSVEDATEPALDRPVTTVWRLLAASGARGTELMQAMMMMMMMLSNYRHGNC